VRRRCPYGAEPAENRNGRPNPPRVRTSPGRPRTGVSEEVRRTILVGRRIDDIVTGPPGLGAEGPARGLGDGLVRPGRQRLDISFGRYYLDLPSTRDS
jgi:hypothetical protein